MSPEEDQEAENKLLLDFYNCIKLGNLTRFDPSDELLKSEIEGAEYDLIRAEESLEKNDLKWALLQAYHSMYHSIRVMVLSKGYIEKNHECLLVALKELYVSQGELLSSVVDNFDMCMEIKHEAEGGAFPSEDSTKMCIDSAKNFLIFAVQVEKE